MTPKERFLSFVEKTDDCWLWNGARNWRRGDYGVFNFHPKVMNAHRASYLLFVGPIPEGMFVCHHCDNPPCVNPEHLFLGTHRDNMQDMRGKGRHGTDAWYASLRRGEAHHGTKLTTEDVRKIRQDPRGCRLIARDYGITKNTVLNIRHRRTWAHV